MNKVSTEGVGIFAQHYPRVAALITARAGSQANVMTAAWHMPISYNPPLYTIAIAPKRFTYSLIAASHEFGVNFMPADYADLVAAIGGSHGAELNKFKAFHISTDEPLKTVVPILRVSYAAYECKVIDDRVYGDHRLIIGEIVAVHWLKEVFMEDGSLDLTSVSPTLYIGNEHYVSTESGTIRTLERQFCIDRLSTK
jgi:flavin reductase (DIM6/NTAB) family NADH-FMN oxidoreductase RutF